MRYSTPLTVSVVAAYLLGLCGTSVLWAQFEPTTRFVRGYDLVDAGDRLTASEARKLELDLASDPQNVDARSRLISYYFGQSNQQARGQHVLWLIQHNPDAPILGTGTALLKPRTNANVFRGAAQLWLKQVDAHPKDVAVVGNAAAFFMELPGGTGEKLLRQAAELDPQDPRWAENLFTLYSVHLRGARGEEAKELATRAFAALEKLYELAPSEEVKRLHALTYITSEYYARVAFVAGEDTKIGAHARELLDLSHRHPREADHGSAVHRGHTILGRVALRAGDLAAAKEHLLASAELANPPGQPAARPYFILAKELLARGERATVAAYLHRCAEFRRQDDGRLAKWVADIDAGRDPELQD